MIASIKDCAPGNDGDYWRWQGRAEARRQLAEALGLSVPHNSGETTGKADAEEPTDG